MGRISGDCRRQNILTDRPIFWSELKDVRLKTAVNLEISCEFLTFWNSFIQFAFHFHKIKTLFSSLDTHGKRRNCRETRLGRGGGGGRQKFRPSGAKIQGLVRGGGNFGIYFLKSREFCKILLGLNVALQFGAPVHKSLRASENRWRTDAESFGIFRRHGTHREIVTRISGHCRRRGILPHGPLFWNAP